MTVIPMTLIPFDPQPRGVPVLIDYESPYTGERFQPHAVEESGGYDAEFYHCDDGDPVDIVQQDGVWCWEV